MQTLVMCGDMDWNPQVLQGHCKSAVGHFLSAGHVRVQECCRPVFFCRSPPYANVTGRCMHADEVKDADGVTAAVTTALFETLSYSPLLEDAEVMAGLVNTLLHISQW